MFPNPKVFPDASRTEHFTPPLALSDCVGEAPAGQVAVLAKRLLPCRVAPKHSRGRRHHREGRVLFGTVSPKLYE
jgi:hypothetical protein